MKLGPRSHENHKFHKINRLFAISSVRSFVNLIVRFLVRSFLRAFFPSVILSILHSFICSFVRSFYFCFCRSFLVYLQSCLCSDHCLPATASARPSFAIFPPPLLVLSPLPYPHMCCPSSSYTRFITITDDRSHQWTVRVRQGSFPSSEYGSRTVSSRWRRPLSWRAGPRQ